MIYLDANVFVFAAADRGKLGKLAGEIIRALESDKNSAVTCCLTVDEVVWAVKKLLGSYELAISAGESLFKIKNLQVLPVLPEDMLRAFGLMKQGLHPRDATHAEVSLNHGVFTIVCEDTDFEKVGNLTLLTFEKCAKLLEK